MIKEADMIINFLIAAVLAGAPLVLATVGEIIMHIYQIFFSNWRH